MQPVRSANPTAGRLRASLNCSRLLVKRDSRPARDQERARDCDRARPLAEQQDRRGHRNEWRAPPRERIDERKINAAAIAAVEEKKYAVWITALADDEREALPRERGRVHHSTPSASGA